MPAIHPIRLRGPWGCQPLARFVYDENGRSVETEDNLPPPGRLTMPADWSGVCGPGFCGRVRLRRRFHWPARLTPRERVWLVFGAVAGSAVVRLNDEILGDFTGSDVPREFDVTEHLEATNVLFVDVTYPDCDSHGGENTGGSGTAGGLTGEVRLEVRSR